MFYSINLDMKINLHNKTGKAVKDDAYCMDWKDDEAYSYSFEEDWQGQGVSIPPRPDCLRGSDTQEQTFYDDEQEAVNYSKNKRKHGAEVDPKRIKQLKTLYQSVVRLNHERNDNSFVGEASMLADYNGDKARHVPFRSYWPTYEAMSKTQREWYFYLRSQLREGKTPKTDLSYLFVYIYELINQVGIKDANDGFVQLCRVWHAYREAYPILDKYLVLWVQDYILIYAGGDFSTMMAHIPEQSLLNLFPDSLSGCFMENPEAGFTLDFISRFSDYRFYTGAMAKSSQGGFFLSLLPKLFQDINQFLYKDKGKGIFEIFRPVQVTGKRRIPFQNAIYSGSVTSVCQDELPYSTYAPLRGFFTSVIKELENRLREQAQIKGRLRGIDLEPKVLSFLQSWLMERLCKAGTEEEKKKLEVDRDRIIQLIEESNLIRQRLLEGIDELTHGVQSGTGLLSVNEAAGENTVNCTVAAGSAKTDDAECLKCLSGNELFISNSATVNLAAKMAESNDKASKGLSQCGDEIVQATTSRNSSNLQLEDGLTEAALLKQCLSENQSSILSFILVHGCEVNEDMMKQAFSQLFLEMEMDEINNHAMDALGDIIITREGGQWLLYEEYRAELEGVFQ